MALRQPPRLTGVAETDVVSLNQWLWDFFNNSVTENAAILGATGFDPSTFDSSKLQDPASATVATAQQTANDAFSLASNAKALAQRVDDWNGGQLTVSETATTATFTFDSAKVQPDTSYLIVALTSSTSGGPPIGSTQIINVAKTVDDFTITINVAPGAGKSVTFDWFLFRF